jgi:hypothetical protein
MRAFGTRIAIAASPRRVWEILAEVERWPEWTPSVVKIERLDPASLGVGSRVRIEQPKLRPAAWTVTTWKPEAGFAWISRSPGLAINAEHLIEATPDGCVVTLGLRFDGLLGALVGLFAGKMTARYMALEADGLKKRSESAP